jgi:diguanylate cyclase (GGDEF)-like protein/PAS domain S-box-containing protein
LSEQAEGRTPATHQTLKMMNVATAPEAPLRRRTEAEVTPSPGDPEMLRRQSQALVSIVRDGTLANGDLESALCLAAAEAGNALLCDRVRIWRRTEGRMRCVHSFDVASQIHEADCDVFAAFNSIFEGLERDRCVLVSDLPAEPLFSEYLEADPRPRPTRSLLATPVLSDGTTIGFVAFEQMEQVRRWRGDEIAFAQAIAGLVALAMGADERATTATALAESEERFRLVAQNMTDLVCLHDWQGRYVWVSPSCRRVLGYEASELKGRDHFSLIHPDDLARVRSSLWARMRRGESVMPTTYRIRRKSGEYGWVETLAQRIVEDGDVIRLQTSSREVTERIAAEQIIAQSEERYRTVVSNTVDGIVLVDAETMAILDANPAFETLVGLRLSDLAERRFTDLLANADEEELNRFASVVPQRSAYRGEQRYVRKDGTTVDVEVNAHTIMYRGSTVICAVARDITVRKQQEDLERDRALALEHIATGEPLDATLQHLTGLVERYCSGMRCAFVLDNSDRFAGFGKFDGPASFAVRSQAKDDGQSFAAPLFSAQGEVLGILTGFSDIQRSPSAFDLGIFMMVARLAAIAIDQQSMNKKLDHQAHHDDLTGLPNRRRLKDRLDVALVEARSNGRGVALLFVDLDRFKIVNDTLGHSAGDTLLTETASRIGGIVRQGDTVARMGGDEFILLAVGLQDAAKDGFALAERVLSEVARPYDIEGHRTFMTASIGIATFPEDGSDAEALIRHADTALYQAKEAGGNRGYAFTPDLQARVSARLELERDLRTALEKDELVVFYQPQFDTRTRRLIGVEALVRWQHPTRGLVSPGAFLPVSEEIGLITEVDYWVLRTAAIQAQAWRAAGFPLRLSVNVSARHFRSPDIAERVKRVLAETGLDPRLLELELTETTAMETAESALDILKGIKSTGVAIAIDDFGTGYSSLSYLKRFPIDALKIDRAFVADLAGSVGGAAIPSAIVAMARALHLRVVAEGVETSDQLHLLESLGCDEVQGYLLGRPMVGDDISRLLSAQAALAG